MFRLGLLIVVTALLPALACGGSSMAEVSPAPMPEGGTFSGVYFSPQYGEMHLVQSGDSVRGTFKKDQRSGKIQGEAEGNLLRFEWVEYKAMIANRPQETEGHGFFQYLVDPATGDHLLKGKWGIQDDHSGGEWNAYKSETREPDPDSLLGEENTSGGESLYDDEGDDDFESEGEEGGADDDVLGDDLF